MLVTIAKTLRLLLVSLFLSSHITVFSNDKINISTVDTSAIGVGEFSLLMKSIHCCDSIVFHKLGKFSGKYIIVAYEGFDYMSATKEYCLYEKLDSIYVRRIMINFDTESKFMMYEHYIVAFTRNELRTYNSLKVSTENNPYISDVKDFQLISRVRCRDTDKQKVLGFIYFPKTKTFDLNIKAGSKIVKKEYYIDYGKIIEKVQ